MVEKFDIEELHENLRTQMTEVEILQSMFPSIHEFQLDDSLELPADVESWITSTDFLPPPIEFTITLFFKNGTNKLEVVVTLPIQYPKMGLPEIYVRSNTLSRKHQTSLNKNLMKYLEIETIQAEPCLVPVVSWLQENGEDYFKESDEYGTEKETSPDCDSKLIKSFLDIGFILIIFTVKSKEKISLT